MKVRVEKDGWDWVAWCPLHELTVWTERHEDALEAAYGHICMVSHEEPVAEVCS